ncbi:hypothetical protein GGI19_004372 [Coemansia pectinata]|uniref:Uncharacterized protein n=1 Tax=Coemansia pectinata TaxID=1052879 RepID=A0A9W8LA31_9FUNG|nr:hypothetical protein GGI19_004372 [Coemansia pectinata]
MVVDHLVGSTRVLSARVTSDSAEHKLLLLPLMRVCQNFRAVISVNFYRANTVKIYGAYYDREVTEYHWSHRLYKFYRYTHHLSQEVRIVLDKPSVFYGEVLDGLSKVPCKDCTFLQARKLKFIFYASHAQKLDCYGERFEEPAQPWQVQMQRQKVLAYEAGNTSHVEANISAFIERIKQMAPKVREIEVECGNIYVDKYPETEYFKTLLVRLFQLTPRIVHRIRDEAGPVKLLADGISNLVHIDIESGSIDPIAQIARQSALTLQYLAIETRGGGDVIGLIKDVDGSYAVYPRLRVLKLKHCFREFWDGKPVFPGVVPLPSLRLLRMSGYPFGDDVFFRGNAATLEYLDMKADSEDIKMFMELGLFTPTSHPKLQHVMFECRLGSAPDPFATDMAYIQFLLNIGPSAAMRGFSYMLSESKISAAVSLLGDYPSIQVLCLPNTRLPLWDAIAIIKSLPSLSDLHSELPTLGPLPDEVTEAELPAYVISNYTQMSERFRCWHLTRRSETPFKEAILCVLLLALICPNFDFCNPFMDHYNNGFMNQLEKAIDSDGFKDHAPRLRRLLFTK